MVCNSKYPIVNTNEHGIPIVPEHLVKVEGKSFQKLPMTPL